MVEFPAYELHAMWFSLMAKEKIFDIKAGRILHIS